MFSSLDQSWVLMKYFIAFSMEGAALPGFDLAWPAGLCDDHLLPFAAIVACRNILPHVCEGMFRLSPFPVRVTITKNISQTSDTCGL
jgi:hypothetical protein